MTAYLHDLAAKLGDDFVAKISIRPDGCWEWTGTLSTTNYGRFGRWYAHRLSCEAVHGPIPKGFHVDHLCRFTRCVNPEHLEAVTPLTNFLRSTHRSAVAARTGLCRRGHSLDEHGAARKDGGRYCKACRRESQRAHYAAQLWPSMIARKHARGSYRRLSEGELVEIRRAASQGESFRSIAKRLGRSSASVTEAARGLTHRTAA